MNWLEFFSTLFSAAVWPITILILIGWAKPYLGRIPEFVQSAKYKDLEVTFRESVTAIKSDAESAGLEIPHDLPEQYKNLFDQNRDRLHLVVLEAWRSIEKLIREKFPWAGARTNRLSGSAPISVMIRELYKEEILSEEEFALLKELQFARNRAAHGQSLSLREQDVVMFLKFTAALTERIRDFPDHIE